MKGWRWPRSRPWSFCPLHPHRDELVRELGLLPATAQVLAVRGLGDPETADRFLRAPLEALSHPSRLPGIPDAAALVWRAAREGRRVTVYGDFDADGVCSVALLVRGLRALGLNVDYYVPHRLREGYGLNAEAVRALGESGTQLLVTVDCGVGALAEVALAKHLGMQVVVLDHHEPPPVLPDADVVVDPKIPQKPYPFRGYCAAGLSWQLVAALRELAGAPATEDLLELAAVGTVADVVPLVEDNRVVVRWGLKRLPHTPLVGLRALLQNAGLTGPASADDVAWRLAPRLNAAGRVDTAHTALRLLLTDDPREAAELASELEHHNSHRQRLQDAALGQALAAVEEDGLADRPGIVVWGQDWHPGVVGLVAGRLREAFWRPAVALAVEGEVARGSARGVPGLDLVVDDVGAAGHQVVDEENPLAATIDALQKGLRGVLALGWVDVDQGHLGHQREGQGQVQPAEGDARDALEGEDVGPGHPLQGAHRVPHHPRRAPEGAGVAGQQPQVDVDGRVEGGAPEGEIAELDGTQVPQDPGQPEVLRVATLGHGA